MNLQAKRILIKGSCPLDCPDTCGIQTEVDDGRAIKIFGDPDHPITKGWLCAKVQPYLDHVYNLDRLTYPLRRIGAKGGGQWQRITWDEAIAEICGRWRGIIDAYGPEAILPYSFSGTLGLLQLEVCNGRFWNRLGASRLERSICGAAARQAVEATLGARLSPPYEDVENSRLVIIWGHNPISTAPHFMPFLRRAQRHGAQLVVIDPCLTRTAKSADWHLAPIPGSDAALALGLAHIIVAEGLFDQAWLGKHTVGWPDLERRLADFPPQRVAELTGLAVTDLQRLARLYAGVKPGTIKISDGLNRNFNGGQSVRAVLCLPAITGQYGLSGGGLSYSTGDFLTWDNEAINKWAESPAPGRWVNMNRLGAALTGETAEPPIKSLYVFAANPAASSPNAAKIIAGLEREDLFTVVHELYLTDTADYADIILPATSQLEHTDLHRGYGHTLLTYNHQAISPRGEGKSNWDVMRLLAAGMDFKESWLSQNAEEVIGEIVSASAAHQNALQGITLERLQQEATIPLSLDPDPPFAGGQFPTPSGKLELYSQILAELDLDPLPGFDESAVDDGGFDGRSPAMPPAESLILLTGAAHHFVSSSLANQKHQQEREGPLSLEIHPTDAAARQISQGQQVVVENGRGSIGMPAVVTAAVRPGVVAVPKGHWPKLSGAQNLNWLTSDALADMAGQSTYHSTRVWVRPATRV